MSDPVVRRIAGTDVEAPARANCLQVAARRFLMFERDWAPNFLFFMSCSIGLVWWVGAPSWANLALMGAVAVWMLFSILSRFVTRNSRKQEAA